MSWNNITPAWLLQPNKEEKKMTDETLVLSEPSVHVLSLPSTVPDQSPMSDTDMDSLVKYMEELAGKPIHMQTDEESELV